jgi:hypothetical protein
MLAFADLKPNPAPVSHPSTRNAEQFNTSNGEFLGNGNKNAFGLFNEWFESSLF